MCGWWRQLPYFPALCGVAAVLAAAWRQLRNPAEARHNGALAGGGVGAGHLNVTVEPLIWLKHQHKEH